MAVVTRPKDALYFGLAEAQLSMAVQPAAAICQCAPEMLEALRAASTVSAPKMVRGHWGCGWWLHRQLLHHVPEACYISEHLCHMSLLMLHRSRGTGTCIVG